ncbi:hypothetical protein AOA80_03280 [Methanomassiliicoccales archaeon RumEn M1]|nr:hypothetical protein AOA80_03280 [Methanomassiliicoccales archaeon RumEn M1]
MISKRVRSIKPSGIRAMFEMATKDSINLGLGELDLEPPQEVTDALKQAADQGRNRYCPTKGIDELRSAVASKVSRYRRDLSIDNVMITCSGTQGAIATYQTLFDPDDEVLIPEPGFVLYEPDAILVGARPVPYGMTEGTFMPDIDDIMGSITSKTKGLVVNSPSNPTGGILDRETFKALCDIADDHDLWIISDEVYEDFIYDPDATHYSFNERIERSVVLNSFSKSLAVPGWRLGYLTASPELVNEISKMQYHLVAAPPTPQQYALAASFHVQQRFLDEIVPLFDRRRKLMAGLLNEIEGFHCPVPKGAFYAFPSYDMPIPSHDLALRIVKAGVIVAPGTAFGERGEGHLRFSYAASEESIVKGLEIVKRVAEE